MAITLRDFLTFPFNNGRGIRANQIDGLIPTSQLSGLIQANQLAGSAGFPSYFSGLDYIAADNHLVATLFPDASLRPTWPSITYFVLPANVGRKQDALSLTFTGATPPVYPILDVHGNAVSAELLSPGDVLGLLRVSPTSVRFFQPLPVRPQDYNILATISADAILDASEIVAATSSGNNMITPPLWVEADGNRHIYHGVPNDTPDIVGIEVSGINQIFAYVRVAGTQDSGAIPYKWWRSFNLQSYLASGQTYTIIQSR